jgi:hypothetical protein
VQKRHGVLVSSIDPDPGPEPPRRAALQGFPRTPATGAATETAFERVGVVLAIEPPFRI